MFSEASAEFTFPEEPAQIHLEAALQMPPLRGRLSVAQSCTSRHSQVCSGCPIKNLDEVRGDRRAGTHICKLWERCRVSWVSPLLHLGPQERPCCLVARTVLPWDKTPALEQGECSGFWLQGYPGEVRRLLLIQTAPKQGFCMKPFIFNVGLLTSLKDCFFLSSDFHLMYRAISR